MKRMPPFLLSAPCIAYVLYELSLLVAQPTATIAVRLTLALVLFYFVLRGSRGAGILWGTLCLVGGLMAMYGAIAFPTVRGNGAEWLAFFGVILLANAAYLYFSPAVRKFQAGPTMSPAP